MRTSTLIVSVAAEAHELALLHHAQQLGLGLQRDVADLVEEQRALVRQLEEALLGVDGAGEGALHVAEEVRLQQVVGQAAGVDDDERPCPRGRCWRGWPWPPAPCRCRSRPTTRIVEREGAAWEMRLKTCCMRGLLPTISAESGLVAQGAAELPVLVLQAALFERRSAGCAGPPRA